MRRIWVDEVVTGKVVLSRDEAHYARDVLRLVQGTRVIVLDDAGHAGLGELTHVASDAVHITVDAAQAPAAPVWELKLGVAVPKTSASDWLVEKLVELGVSELVWLHTERSVQRRGDGRMERWERVARAAVRQSRRVRPMRMRPPVALQDFLDEPADIRFTGDPDGAPLDIAGTPWKGVVAGVIGPEGGFTSAELESLSAVGYHRVCVSPHILRVETAAIALASVLTAHADGPAECSNSPAPIVPS